MADGRWKIIEFIINDGPKNLTHIFGVLVQTSFYELLELFGEISSQLGRIILGDEEEDPHGMEVGVWRLSLGQLDSRDAQRPDVRLGVVRCNTIASPLRQALFGHN